MHIARRSFATTIVIASGAMLGVLCATPACAAGVAHLSRTTVAFSIVPAFAIHVQPVFVTNTGDAPLNVSSISLSGTNASDFTLSGTCGTTITLAAGGGRCRIDISSFLADSGGTGRVATLAIASDSSTAVPEVRVLANYSRDIAYGLVTTPNWLDFAGQPVGTAAPTQTFVIVDAETIGPLNFLGVVFRGGDSTDFVLTTNCKVGANISNGATCSVTVGFMPTATGPRSTELEVDFQGLSYRYSVTGVGGAAAPGSPTTVVEYYWATRDHYFISSNAAEIAALDAAPPGGWVRTGRTFKTMPTVQTGTSPVCRFYLPPQFGDSHFYGRGTAECDATHASFPGFIYESPAVMYMYLPTLGVCAAGTTPVYRVFDARIDANHRYTTDRALRDQMVAQGWVAEGDGPDLVVMCAPQ